MLPFVHWSRCLMTIRIVCLFVLFLGASGFIRANDWPQWRGPDRNGISKETGLLKQWPKDGPKLRWKITGLGNGYSTPAVAGGRIYLQSDRGNDEFAIALDEKDGKEVWSAHIGKVGKNRGPQYPGTRSTPTVDGDYVYCLSSDGELVCLEKEQGKIKWQKQLKQDFGGKMGMWAYSESPLIDGDVLVCTPGGKEATLVGLNKADGSVIWKCAVAEGDDAAYASVIIAEVAGAKQYIQFLSRGLVGVDAKTGKPLWRYKKTIDVGANIPTPIFHDGQVFSATGRNAGAVVKLTPNEGMIPSETWLSKKIRIGLGGAVLVGQHLYGTTAQELLCIDFNSGNILWHNKSVGPGSVCYADGNIYLRSDNGAVALVEATPERYQERGRFSQPQRGSKPAWPYPIIANGCLYLRDQDFLYCYDVREPNTSTRR
jgi:outer membrane protein assembly factor BamB